MALKFRRGTTAQKSGSLAFGEPYVNTTLQTLQIGLDGGDVTLSAITTGSNLVVASVSGEILATNGVVSGSSQLTTDFDARYLNTSGDGIVSGSSQVTLQSTTGFSAFDTALATITGSLITSASADRVSITNLNTFSGSQLTQNTALATITGSLITSASTAKTTNDSQDVSISNLNTFSSSQLTKDSDLATYTGSVNTKLTEIGVVTGSLISSASTAKTTNDSQGVSITNLNTYTGSLKDAIQLTGSTVSFLGNIVVYGTQSIINSTNLAVSDNMIYLNNESTVTDPDLGIAGNYNDGVYAHTGIFSDASDGHAWKVFKGYTAEPSGTIDTTGNGFTLADFKAGAFTGTSFSGQILSTNGVVSGSSQIQLGSASGNIALATQTTGDYVASLVAGTNITLSNNSGENATPTIGLTNNAITIAGQSTSLGGTVTADTIRTAIGTVVTGSSQIDLTATTNYASGILTRLNAVGVFSGSAQVSGITNAQLVNSTISGVSLGSNLGTLTIGTGLSGTSYNGSTGVTIANTGVTSNVAGTGISVSGATGAVTITNSGVTSAVAGTGVSVSGATGAVTISIGQSVATNATPTFGNLTINGTITATGDITAYYTSDRRHKNNIQTISNAVLKVKQLNGVTWEWNDDVNEVTKSTPKTGLIAQEVQQVLPQVVIERENGFLALDYSKMVGLLVEAIKEQQIQIDQLKAQIGSK